MPCPSGCVACPWYPALVPAGWGWSLYRRLLFVPCSRWLLISGWSSLRLGVFGSFWISTLCSLDRRSASRSTCSALPPVTGCLLCLVNSPSGEASASACRFSWRPGAAGALAVTLTAAASLRVFYTLCLVLPLRGSDTYLTFVTQLEALSESLTHSIPCSFLVVALSVSAVGFADALWLCTERALRLFFVSVSFFDTVALLPLSRSVSADGFRHW